LVAVVVLVIGGTGVVLARSTSQERVAAEAQAAQLEVLSIRNELIWLHHDLLTAGLVAEYRNTEVDPELVDQFLLERTAMVDQLRVLAAGDGLAAVAAAEFVEITDWARFDEWPFDAEELDGQHFELIFPSGRADLEGEWPLHAERVEDSMLPRLVLIDGLSLVLADESQDGDPVWGSTFVGYTMDMVINAPGWLGPERESPLSFSYGSGMSGYDPGPEASASLADLQLVWDYDQWLIDRIEPGSDGEPPMTIDQLIAAAGSATEALRLDVQEALQDDAEVIIDAAPGSTAVMVWYGVGVGSVLAVTIAFGLVLSRLWGGNRMLAETALTDALTGARNRRFLDTEVADRCKREHTNHVIVMVDLDRFKMINDTWGHDAGDGLLRLLSSRLAELTTRLGAVDPDLEAAVVRRGGDEFIVALHSVNSPSLIELERQLRALTGPVDLGRDEPIDLQFSLGIATGYGAVDLADLAKAADFAAYEDKRRRSAARVAPQETEPTIIEVF
jgi:diguanylate cyclase (GGDEF)-like protein